MFGKMSHTSARRQHRASSSSTRKRSRTAPRNTGSSRIQEHVWVNEYRRRKSVSAVGQSEASQEFSLAAMLDAIHTGDNVEQLDSAWLKMNFTGFVPLDPLETPFAPPPPPSAEVMARAALHCPTGRAGWHGEEFFLTRPKELCVAHDGDRRMGHFLYVPAEDECPTGAGCQHTLLPNGTEMWCRFCVVQGMLAKGEKYGWPLCPSCLCDEENIDGGCRFPNGSVPVLKSPVGSKLPPDEEACPAHRCFSHPEEIKNNLFRYADAEACSSFPAAPGCIGNTGCRMCVTTDTQSTGTCPPCVCDQHDVSGCAVSDVRAENELDGTNYTIVRNISTALADISTLKGGYDYNYMRAHDACIQEGYPGLCRRDSVIFYMSEVNTLISRDMYFPTPADKVPRVNRVSISKDPQALEMIGWTAEGTKGYWKSGPDEDTPGQWIQDDWLVNGNAWCCKSSVPHSHALAATVDTGMIEYTSSLAAMMSDRLYTGSVEFTFDFGTVIPPNRSCSVEFDLASLKVIYSSQAPGAVDGESSACAAGEEAEQGVWITTPDMEEHSLLTDGQMTVFRDLTGSLQPYAPADSPFGYSNLAPKLIPFTTIDDHDMLLHLRVAACHVHGGPGMDNYQVAFRARVYGT